MAWRCRWMAARIEGHCSFAQAFNRLQGRSGTLFEERMKSVHVDNDAYIVHLCRYIHLNPVAAGLVGEPGSWRFSNYLE